MILFLDNKRQKKPKKQTNILLKFGSLPLDPGRFFYPREGWNIS